MQTLKKTWGKGNNPRLPKGEGPQPAKEEDRRPAANTRMPPRLQLRSHARSDFALAVYPDRPQKEACIQVAQDIATTAWLRAAMYKAGYKPGKVGYTPQQIGILMKYYKTDNNHE